MPDGAWDFLGVLVLTLFGAGGYLQWRRTRKVESEVTKVERGVTPIAADAAEAKAKIDVLLPVITDLQRRLTDAEDAQVELAILLAAHGEWDLRVLSEIRKYDPHFPDPPPLRRRDLP